MKKIMFPTIAIIVLLAGTISASAYASGITSSHVRSEAASSTNTPFCRLPQAIENQLTQIVLADSRIQKLIEGKNYTFTVNGKQFKGNIGISLSVLF